MNEQGFPLAVGQHIIVKCITSENVKSTEVPTKIRSEVGDETLSWAQECDWSKSFKECRTEVENMRRLRLLQGRYSQSFFDGEHSRCLIANSTTNHQRALLFEAY
jgi:hypothetical protein